MDGYEEFLSNRLNIGSMAGFSPSLIPQAMFEFQKFLLEWSVAKGRSAIFADCGLGKTFIELAWAQNVVEHTCKPVLILSPLGVSAQTIAEAAKFDIKATRSRDGNFSGVQVIVTNYERLHLFSPDAFGGVVCDESSILKSFDGKRKQEITDFMRKMPYRLLATATAAPNDYTELGTSSEALGYLGHVDMLTRFFKNDQNNVATKRMYGEAPAWRFKGHAETPFWRWVTSWARACRKPSDLGFDDDGLSLPALSVKTHMVDIEKAPDGMLFTLPATNLFEQRDERRRTLVERCEAAANLVSHDRPAVVWCHMNDEGDLLEKLIPNSVQVSGSDSDDNKEAKFEAFGTGNARVMITKPRIGAWGLNWQHAAHVVYFPSHSYEAYYQAVRRCWRFGQKNEVVVDLVMTEGEKRVMANLMQKAEKADKMFASLVREMNNSLAVSKITNFPNREKIPSWL